MKISAQLPHYRWKLMALVIILLTAQPGAWAGGGGSLKPAQDLIAVWDSYMTLVSSNPVIAQTLQEALSKLDKDNLAHLILNVRPDTRHVIFTHMVQRGDNRLIRSVQSRVLKDQVTGPTIPWGTLLERALSSYVPPASSDEDSESEPHQDTSSPAYTPVPKQRPSQSKQRREAATRFVPPEHMPPASGGQSYYSSSPQAESGSESDDSNQHYTDYMDTDDSYLSDTRAAKPVPQPTPRRRLPATASQPSGAPATQYHIHHHMLDSNNPHQILQPATAMVVQHKQLAGVKPSKSRRVKRSSYQLPFLESNPPGQPEPDFAERGQTVNQVLLACSDLVGTMDDIGEQIGGDMSQGTIRILANLNIASLVDMVTSATGLNLMKMVPVFTLYDDKKPFSSLQKQLKIFQDILISSGAFTILGKHTTSLIPLLLLQQGRIAHATGTDNPNIESLESLTTKFGANDEDTWAFIYQLLDQLDLKLKKLNLKLYYRGAESVLSGLPYLNAVTFENPDDVAQHIADSVNNSRRGQQRPALISAEKIKAAKYSILISNMGAAGISNPNLEAVVGILKMHNTVELPSEPGGFDRHQLADLDSFTQDPPEKKFRKAFQRAIKTLSKSTEDYDQVEALIEVLLRRSQFLPPELMAVYNNMAPVGTGATAMATSAHHAAAGDEYGDDAAEGVLHLVPAHQRKSPRPAGMTPYQPQPSAAPAIPAIPGRLTGQDLPQLTHRLREVMSQWHTVGLYLNISNSQLNALELQHRSDPAVCLRETIQLWLNGAGDSPTWAGLIKALKMSQNNSLAYKIEEYVAEIERANAVFQRTPTVLNIRSLRTPQGAPLNVIQTLAVADVDSFGMHLLQDEHGTTVSTIRRDCLGQGTEAVVSSILQKWLTSGSAPMTWQHLIDAAVSIQAGRLAEQLKVAIPALEARKG